MSVEFWRNAEKFYEFWIIIIAIFIMTSIMAIIFIISYAKEKNKKKIMIIVMGCTTIVGGFGATKYTQYYPYLEQASYSNPLIRDREPRLMSYVYYGQAEEVYYKKLNHLNSLRNMDLYEEKQINEPITYLGQGKYFYYFERANKQLFKKKNKNIEFTETVQQAQLIGSKFVLKDDTFKEIGFKNPENVMFESIKIPSSEKEKSYEPTDEFQIPQAEKGIAYWNF